MFHRKTSECYSQLIEISVPADFDSLEISILFILNFNKVKVCYLLSGSLKFKDLALSTSISYRFFVTVYFHFALI